MRERETPKNDDDFGRAHDVLESSIVCRDDPEMHRRRIVEMSKPIVWSATADESRGGFCA